MAKAEGLLFNLYNAHSKRVRHYCGVCQKHFSRRDHLTRHQKEQHSLLLDEKAVGFLCFTCQRLFKRKEHLKRHLSVCATEGEVFICPSCATTFKNEMALRIHLQEHDELSDNKDDLIRERKSKLSPVTVTMA